jgi:hypothetical protein
MWQCKESVRATLAESNSCIGAPAKRTAPSYFDHHRFLLFIASPQSLPDPQRPQPLAQDICERIGDIPALCDPHSHLFAPTPFPSPDFWTTMICPCRKGAALVYPSIHSLALFS